MTIDDLIDELRMLKQMPGITDNTVINFEHIEGSHLPVRKITISKIITYLDSTSKCETKVIIG